MVQSCAEILSIFNIPNAVPELIKRIQFEKDDYFISSLYNFIGMIHDNESSRFLNSVYQKIDSKVLMKPLIYGLLRKADKNSIAKTKEMICFHLYIF